MFTRVRAAAVSLARQRRGLATSRVSTADKSSTVGFIGLGNMGGHMARNLMKNGHSIVVNDVNTAVMDDFAANGAEVELTPAGVAAKAQTVVTMLPSNPHVLSVYTGDDGIFSTAEAGALFIDASTIDPTVSQSVAAQAEELGGRFVDAPVSGGVGGAEAGTLTFMVGGPEADFEAAKVFLKDMGKNIVHCGGHGTGQGVKICNNMMLAISMIGTSETMNLGVRLGIDPKLLAGVLNTSSGQSWSSQVYNPCPGVMEGVPASRGYTGGFGTALMSKDLGLAMSAASSSKSAVPLGSLANQIYALMSQQGFAEKDFSSAFQYLNDEVKK